MTQVYAHRGASGAFPENTMLAFEEAIRAGATGIETDVQMSRDGVLVLCHDETVDRTTDSRGLIGQMDSCEVLALDAGSWFGPEFARLRIPTLEELLRMAAKHDIMVNLELKNYIVRYPGMEERVIEQIKRCCHLEQIILSSFSHSSMVLAKALEPGIRTGILVCCDLYQPVEYARSCGADALHPDYMTVTPQLVDAMHKADLSVNVYTVDDPGDILRMQDYGVDVVMTDHPRQALKALHTTT